MVIPFEADINAFLVTHFYKPTHRSNVDRKVTFNWNPTNRMASFMLEQCATNNEVVETVQIQFRGVSEGEGGGFSEPLNLSTFQRIKKTSRDTRSRAVWV